MQELQDFTILDHHLGCFRTFSGKKIKIKNPQVDDIDIRDIAAALSKICRFGGHSSEFYSVAQHSVLVALMVPKRLRAAALLHDASEAYLGDVIKPLKVILGPIYAELEANFQRVIMERFLSIPPLADLLASDKEEIKKCDILALQIENEAFKHGNPDRLRFFFEKYDMLQTDVQLGWPPFLAQTLFTRYAQHIL